MGLEEEEENPENPEKIRSKKIVRLIAVKIMSEWVLIELRSIKIVWRSQSVLMTTLSPLKLMKIANKYKNNNIVNKNDSN
jgi:hypothetical protein